MALKRWVCESCESHHPLRSNIWKCIRCRKETCESCFDRFVHCVACGEGKSDEELRVVAVEAGYDEFTKEKPDMTITTGPYVIRYAGCEADPHQIFGGDEGETLFAECYSEGDAVLIVQALVLLDARSTKGKSE